jgi:hypothetical protein
MSQGAGLVSNVNSLCNLVVVSVQNLPHSAKHKMHSTEHARGGEFPLFLYALTSTSTPIHNVFYREINRLDVGFLSRDTMYSGGWFPKSRRNLLPRPFTQVTSFTWKWFSWTLEPKFARDFCVKYGCTKQTNF